MSSTERSPGREDVPLAVEPRCGLQGGSYGQAVTAGSSATGSGRADGAGAGDRPTRPGWAPAPSAATSPYQRSLLPFMACVTDTRAIDTYRATRSASASPGWCPAHRAARGRGLRRRRTAARPRPGAPARHAGGARRSAPPPSTGSPCARRRRSRCRPRPPPRAWASADSIPSVTKVNVVPPLMGSIERRWWVRTKTGP
jgi:hypothetical protein